jgi:hypothetical protein
MQRGHRNLEVQDDHGAQSISELLMLLPAPKIQTNRELKSQRAKSGFGGSKVIVVKVLTT